MTSTKYSFKTLKTEVNRYVLICCVVNLFNSFCLIKTYLLVVHGPYLSIYNIENKEWLRHIKFEEDDILKMVKVVNKKGFNTRIELTVMLKFG